MKRPWTLCRVLGSISVAFGCVALCWFAFAIIRLQFSGKVQDGMQAMAAGAMGLGAFAFWPMALGAALLRLDAIAWHVGESTRILEESLNRGDSSNNDDDAQPKSAT